MLLINKENDFIIKIIRIEKLYKFNTYHCNRSLLNVYLNIVKEITIDYKFYF